MSLFRELKRRNVFKVTIAYVALAWLAIQVADVILNNTTAPDWIFDVLLLFLAIGLPFAVFFAWAFELTPAGLKRESEVDRAQSITPRTGKYLNLVIYAVMALALGYFAWDKFVRDASRDEVLVESADQAATDRSVAAQTDKSIAVLPFVNMSSDAEQDYFSDGLSEELLNLLAKVPQLRVIARTSSFAYKGKAIQISDVARELNVNHVLEGSVRKAGNQLRITAQLIRASDSSHLWSETYDRSLDDIFAIQDEIAAAVVAELKVTLLGDAPTVREVNPQAYTLYLQALHLSSLGSWENVEQSRQLFEQALAVEPDYAPAWVGLADIYARQTNFGFLPLEEGFRLVRESARQALAIDPDFAAAHALLGWVADTADNDLAAAARHLRHALELAPSNLDVIGWSAMLLNHLGRVDEAIVLRQYLVTRDPVAPIAHYLLGINYLWADRPDDAIASFRSTLRLSPGLGVVHTAFAQALMSKGEAAGALEELELEPMESFVLSGRAMAFHSLGQSVESDEALNELIGKYEQEAAYLIAYVLAWRGDTDPAFAWLDKAVAYRDTGLPEIAANPLFEKLYDDPRWLPFLESVGRSPAQLASIEFEVTLPE